jgi:SAM-dependent methyltransferase
MRLRPYGGRLKKRLNLLLFKVRNLHKETFECPVCGYRGPFMDFASSSGLRKHAQCPDCKALERHRIQFVAVKEVLRERNTAHWKMLHFAPETCLRKVFSQRFGHYESADLRRTDVDHKVDLQQLPFADETYDFVFASHVLEHIPDDEKAISEIRRILKPHGIAILPVPIVGEKTIEYSEPNPHDSYHVRVPGRDYFDRYERHFSKVETFSSDRLPKKYQLFIYEDRSPLPTKGSPLRLSKQGEKYSDIVPVCYV